jgi:formyltetrahydrofolate dehydrogenase
LIEGEETAGFSIFWADEGLDTGPILLQRSCPVKPDDTLDSLYKGFMYPEGIKAMGEAVRLVAEGKAPAVVQPEDGATYDAMLNKKELQRLVWEGRSAKRAHDFVRALDSTPGAWTLLDGTEARLYGSSLWPGDSPPAIT